jgi:hypothetical protein
MPAPAASLQASDIFVSKVDPSGAVALLGTFGGKGNDVAYGIALDPSGNICISGNPLPAIFRCSTRCGPNYGGQPRCTILDHSDGQYIFPSYAGAAPGLITGIVQINFPVSNSSSFTLVVNDSRFSDAFSIFLTR